MPRRAWAAVALLFVLPVAASGQGDEQAPPPAPPPPPLDMSTRDFDQVHLDLTVKPDLEKGTVEGVARHEFTSLVDGLATLRLHSQDTEVRGVVCPKGSPLKFETKDGVLSIALPAALKSGEATSVTITYTSTPKLGLLFHRPTPENPGTPLFLYSQGQGSDNRRWVPCYDEPDDRLTWDLHVTAPKALKTVSNGTLATSKENADGTRTDDWHFPWRSPTYLLSLIVADLETVTETWTGKGPDARPVSVEYNAVPGRHEELVTALRETPHMLGVFSELTGEAYPWPRYAQTFVWDFLYGGMENTTATTLNMRALHTEAARPNYMSEGLVAHELAHMWFGDLLTCKSWDHIWLNEGFATYLTDVWFEHRHGEEALLLRRREQNEGYMAGTPDAGALDLKKEPRGDIPVELHGGKQYDRGAAILHTLRREIGDEAFWDGVKRYVAGRRDCAVTSEDLRHAMEAAAGRDLKWFWEQWVYGAGYPVLEVTHAPGSNMMTVRQVQSRRGPQGLFRITVPVRAGADGPVQRMLVTQEKHDFFLGRPAPYVRVGVQGDLLMKVRYQPSLDTLGVMLRDPDVNARLDAAYALEPYGQQGVAALATAVEKDASYAVREECARVLGRLQGGEWGADATKALIAAAKDEDPRVRETALEALGAGPRALVAATLLQAARTETKDYPRAAAAKALGRVHAEGAFEELEKLLAVESHGDCVRAAALEGMAALGSWRGTEKALAFLDYKWGKGANHKLRETALNVATSLAPDDRDVHARLVALLSDPYHRMRAWAAEACGKFKVRAALPKLKELAEKDWHGSVKGAAKAAVERLEAPKK
jgi:aminopeptidase N